MPESWIAPPEQDAGSRGGAGRGAQTSRAAADAVWVARALTVMAILVVALRLGTAWLMEVIWSETSDGMDFESRFLWYGRLFDINGVLHLAIFLGISVSLFRMASAGPVGRLQTRLAGALSLLSVLAQGATMSSRWLTEEGLGQAWGWTLAGLYALWLLSLVAALVGRQPDGRMLVPGVLGVILATFPTLTQWSMGSLFDADAIGLSVMFDAGFEAGGLLVLASLFRRHSRWSGALPSSPGVVRFGDSVGSAEAALGLTRYANALVWRVGLGIGVGVLMGIAAVSGGQQLLRLMVWIGPVASFFIALMMISGLWTYAREARPGRSQARTAVGLMAASLLIEVWSIGLVSKLMGDRYSEVRAAMKQLPFVEIGGAVLGLCTLLAVVGILRAEALQADHPALRERAGRAVGWAFATVALVALVKLGAPRGLPGAVVALAGIGLMVTAITTVVILVGAVRQTAELLTSHSEGALVEDVFR